MGEMNLHVAIVLGSIPRWPQDSLPSGGHPCIVPKTGNMMVFCSMIRLCFNLSCGPHLSCEHFKNLVLKVRVGAEKFKI